MRNLHVGLCRPKPNFNEWRFSGINFPKPEDNVPWRCFHRSTWKRSDCKLRKWCLSSYSCWKKSGIKLLSKNAETVTREITEALGSLPDRFVKSITFDNNSEFCMHQSIEKALNCNVYFADPYSPWQRGLNEHINGRIRYYLPKKKSFAHFADEFIYDSIFSINARPRKSRGWKSPADILNSYIVALQTWILEKRYLL